jgi:uncharacterized protein
MKPIIAALILLVLSLLAGPAAAQPEPAAGAGPYLQVRGEMELQVPADQFRVSIGVISRAETAGAALEGNSAAMREVEQAFRRLGLQQQEYRTGHFSIQPLWSRPSSPDRQPEITGFSVTNSFLVATRKLALAGPLIEAAAQAGANSIGDLVFELAEPAAYRAEAIHQATSLARHEAQILATAAGVSLEEIIVLHLDQAAVTPQRLSQARMEYAMAGEPPLVPGQVAVRAAVAVTYRIAPAPMPH